MSGDLDEFFARAEDVLTDWRGSADAMDVRVSAPVPVSSMVYTGQARRTGPVTLVLNVDTRGFVDAITRAMGAMNRAALAAGAALREFAERMNRKALPLPVKHSFRPDFDLRCTAPGCNLLPEEH